MLHTQSCWTVGTESATNKGIKIDRYLCVFSLQHLRWSQWKITVKTSLLEKRSGKKNNRLNTLWPQVVNSFSFHKVCLESCFNFSSEISPLEKAKLSCSAKSCYCVTPFTTALMSEAIRWEKIFTRFSTHCIHAFKLSRFWYFH